MDVMALLVDMGESALLGTSVHQAQSIPISSLAQQEHISQSLVRLLLPNALNVFLASTVIGLE